MAVETKRLGNPAGDRREAPRDQRAMGAMGAIGARDAMAMYSMDSGALITEARL